MKEQRNCAIEGIDLTAIDAHKNSNYCQGNMSFHAPIKSSYVTCRSITRKEAARYTAAIKLGNEARSLKAQISNSSEECIRAQIAAGNSPSENASMLIAASGNRDLVDYLAEVQEIGARALSDLVERTYPLARWVVDSCIKAPMTFEQRQDAIGDAAEILLEVAASGKYDYRRSSFSHFYKTLAVGKLYKKLNENRLVKIDNDHVRVKLALESKCSKFYQEHHREADYNEQASMLASIVSSFGKTPRKGGYNSMDVAYYHDMQPACSLSEPVHNEGCEVGDLLASEGRIADEDAYQLAFEDLRIVIDECLDVLSERDRDIVLERSLGEEDRLTLDEIAEKYSISKQRVSQIIAESFKKIARKCDLNKVRASYVHASACRELTY